MLLRKMLLVTCFNFAGFLLQAQVRTDNYETRWKTIDSLVMRKGLIQSALTEVNSLYARAKQEKDDVQVIKALIYRMRLEAVTNEETVNSQVRGLEEEIGTAKQPARSILQSVLATVYWNYFQQHRGQLYGRTHTVNFTKTDIATWDAADFHKRISQLYRSSLQEEKILQQTKVDEYDPILIRGTLRALRPTLFDLLAHIALDYFKNNEPDLNRPAYAFELDDPAIFSEAPTFVSHVFTSSDSLSLHFRALQLFQRLIALHLSDARPDALLDVDIDRIGFAQNYGVMDDKDTLYGRALAHLTGRYPDEPSAAQAWYLQAVRYRDQATKYDPTGDTTDRYAYLPAKAICEKVSAEKDSSEGKANCQQLLQQILQESMNLQTERVNIPGQPFRTLLSWRNFSQLYLRVIRLDSAHRQLAFLNTAGDNYWKKMLALPVLTTMTQPLPETGDHQFHRTEIKIDALPVGEYALLAGTDKDFSPDKNILSVQYFFVSAISYVNYDREYFILNRENGQPLTGATVKCWNKTYNYRTSQYDLSLDGSYQTDAHGHLSLDPATGQRSNEKVLEISLPGDHLLSDNLYVPYYANNNKENTPPPYTYLFSDRSIYRPGQTVYFKGILVQRREESGQAKPLSGFTSEIGLYNANGEKVDSLTLTTNDYGSYQGKFTLPENQLNGLFSLRSNNTIEGQLEFSVEEYRRPTFNVQYEKLKGSYRVGDTIRVTGNANAYAGNAIDGATVKYRVVRKARFPDFWFYRPRGRSSTQEIAHGELKTGPTGKFTVPFTALPDRSINRQEDPIFEYQVSADITDINGETRSGETTVSAGYRSLELFIERPSGDPLSADSLRELVIRTANLSGEPEPAALDIRIFPLQSPQRLIRARYWEQPDQFVLSPQEYLAAFPHDEYRDETKKETWPRKEQLFSTVSATDSTGIAHIPIPKNAFASGWYLAEVRTKDRSGQEVQDRQYIELYDGKTGQPATPQYKWGSGQPPAVEPGEKASVPTGSSAANLFLIRNVSRKAPDGTAFTGNPGISSDKPGKFDFLSLNNERKITEFPVTENDRGGFWISDAFVKDNRFYTHSTFINVPWTNKELNINYLTYRDKTLPGSAETWEVKINGNKGQQVAAEALAAMYDASLDQFRMQSWSIPDLYETFSPTGNWQQQGDFSVRQSQEKYDYHPLRYFFNRSYDQLLSPAYYGNGGISHRRSLSPQMAMVAAPGAANGYYDDVVVTALGVAKPNMKNEAKEALADSISIVPQEGRQSASATAAEPPVSIRKNFAETAFFFPDLRTDSAGDISFSFTMPEALTRWKWMTLAHTKDLSFGYSEKTIVTQKQLMVQPNLPRFLREGDRLELSVKIVNLTDSELTGQVELALTDPTTGETADGWFINRQPNQYFTVGARQSTVIGFPIEVPYQYNRPLTYRFIARARDYSDGEQATLPVVSNRMLVTESLPLNMPGDGKRSFRFEKLLQSGASETLNHHALTVEFTSNPAWYAVQALPYLMEYPYQCAEQTFNRFYANALAAHIVASSPRIKEVFAKWRTSDTAALLSNLQKNTELKSVLLEETPWVLQGKSESQQKKNIALLFDMVRMSRELGSSLIRLSGMQSPNGGFVWFKGGPDDRYITQYILTGIGHLQKLNAIPPASLDKIKAIVTAALPYLDTKLKEDYERELRLNKSSVAKPGKILPDIPWTGNLPVQYLYMRSFFSDYGIPGDVFPAVNYYRKQVQQHWVTMSKYMQGMTALALFRTGDLRTAKDILASLQQTAIRDEEKGMYWKGMEGGYYWYQAPIETQSLLIEAFREIGANAATDKDLKTWLLRQKQTHNWSTTKATADACYALLLGGADWLTAERSVTIKLGDKTIIAGNADDSSAVTPQPGTSFVPTEAGTGYFKKVFDGPFVNPSMGNITVILSQSAAGGSPAWGAVYWQYFDNLDRITPPGGGKAALHLVKKLFIERNTDRGPVLEPVSENGTVKVGDKLKVRIELQVDRDMEYVHMKDMRASCLEPVNVISQYKWQGGLGYYESTKDASTDFFFSRVGRGTYVFEYPLFVGQAGNFSNGVTTIECLYAPEFSWHSEGIRINSETQNP